MGHTRRDAVIRSQPPNYARRASNHRRVNRNRRTALAVGRRRCDRAIKSKIVAQPVDGLAVGKDDAGAVGPYQTPFPFTGTITSVEWTRQ